MPLAKFQLNHNKICNVRLISSGIVSVVVKSFLLLFLFFEKIYYKIAKNDECLYFITLKIGISEGNENLNRQNTLQVINFRATKLLNLHLLLQ